MTGLCVCAVCGYAWKVRMGREPKRCPNPKCRSMRWRGSGDAETATVSRGEPMVAEGVLAAEVDVRDLLQAEDDLEPARPMNWLRQRLIDWLGLTEGDKAVRRECAALHLQGAEAYSRCRNDLESLRVQLEELRIWAARRLDEHETAMSVVQNGVNWTHQVLGSQEDRIHRFVSSLSSEIERVKAPKFPVVEARDIALAAKRETAEMATRVRELEAMIRDLGGREPKYISTQGKGK